MAVMKQKTSVATLIGDLVGSRRAVDRQRLHASLTAALAEVSADSAPIGDFRVSAGDECQAAFADVGSALRAAWRLRWLLHAETELRFGIGWGPVRVLQEEPRVEDGPGWWAARAAVEWVHAQAERPGTRHLRTGYRRGGVTTGPDPAAVNAALLCRDHVVGSLSDRSSRILGRLVAHEPQAAIAEAEGISASAVSQRVRKDGLAAVLAAQALLEGLGEDRGEARGEEMGETR